MTSTPIFDEIHRFMQTTRETFGGVSETFKKFSTDLQQLSDGIQQMRIQQEQRTARLRKQRQRCLHGRTRMKIEYNVLLDCSRCNNKQSVVVGAERSVCLLCGWDKKR